MPADPLPRNTERIVLRRLDAEDLAAFQAYRCDPEVARYQGWESTSDAEALAFLKATNTEALLQPGAWSQIAIAEQPDGRLIGDIGICLSEDAREAEIGFSLNRQSQGKGLAGEAVREAILLVFEQSAAEKVIGITDARNQPSIRLLERLGFQKIREAETVFQNEACTEFVFMISRDALAG